MYNKCIVTGRKNDGLDRPVIKPSSQGVLLNELSGAGIGTNLTVTFIPLK